MSRSHIQVFTASILQILRGFQGILQIRLNCWIWVCFVKSSSKSSPFWEGFNLKKLQGSHKDWTKSQELLSRLDGTGSVSKFLVISNPCCYWLDNESSLLVGWFTWGYPQEHNEGAWKFESTLLYSQKVWNKRTTQTLSLPFLFLPQFSSKVKQLGVSLKIWENFNSMFGQPSQRWFRIASKGVDDRLAPKRQGFVPNCPTWGDRQHQAITGWHPSVAGWLFFWGGDGSIWHRDIDSWWDFRFFEMADVSP